MSTSPTLRRTRSSSASSSASGVVSRPGSSTQRTRGSPANTTAEEAKRLEDSFNMMDDHQVDLEIRNVTIQIDSATVTTQRSDTITVRGRTQNGNTRQSTFTLSKQGGSWVITQIQ